MRYLFEPSSLRSLAEIARSNVLLAFDYDGTLSPIVEDPGSARMRPRTRELLTELAKLYRCVVISGRSQDDALRRLRGVGVSEVIGNHGLEPWRRTESFAAMVREWLPVLKRDLEPLPGVALEDKIFSLAVHYRGSPSRRVARSRILLAASRLRRARVVGGKCVVNLIPDDAPNKGVALDAARRRLACKRAVYVGDDETDEDVFAIDDPGRLVTIRVRRKATSRAAFFIRDQTSIDRLLSTLTDLRRKAPYSGTRGPRYKPPRRRYGLLS
jgi:trehalose 6-phosphate phosphatase